MLPTRKKEKKSNKKQSRGKRSYLMIRNLSQSFRFMSCLDLDMVVDAVSSHCKAFQALIILFEKKLVTYMLHKCFCGLRQ